MNELKEIGGYIISADPYVNHDNTLSGNGTVNSPLGVMPSAMYTLSVSDIQLVNELPQDPVAGVLYLIPET